MAQVDMAEDATKSAGSSASAKAASAKLTILQPSGRLHGDQASPQTSAKVSAMASSSGAPASGMTPSGGPIPMAAGPNAARPNGDDQNPAGQLVARHSSSDPAPAGQPGQAAPAHRGRRGRVNAPPRPAGSGAEQGSPSGYSPAHNPGQLPSQAPDGAADEKAKVIHLVQRLQAEASQGRARRKPWVAVSLLAAVVLPTLVMALYFLVWAADGFVSEARFAVRSNDAQNASVLGILSGMPASTIVSDSYIVSDYIHSREMVEALESRVGLRAIYSHPEADYFTRLDPDATLEELISYWETRADVYYDSTKNTIAVEVQAFSPQDAQRVTAAIVDIVRNLVNELSAQSRRDAVGFAASEVARAELRVRGARQDMLAFRTAHNEFDPTATAAATLQLTSQLEAERSQLNSQLAAVSGYLSAEAPSVQMLKARIAALGGEIGRVQNQISQDPAVDPANDPAVAGDDPIGARVAAAGRDPNALATDPTLSPTDRNGLTPDGLAGSTGAGRVVAGGAPGDRNDPDSANSPGSNSGASNSGALASVVGRYQELLLSQQFAETAYTAAQASLEAARTDAARIQSYLAIYVHPHVAEDATYPRRTLNILMVLILATVLWAVGALTAMTVRDHMP